MNQIAQAIDKLKQALASARAKLVAARDSFPEATPVFDALIQELDAEIAVVEGAFGPAGLSGAIMAAAKELAAVPQVGLKPNPKPSDVTGG